MVFYSTKSSEKVFHLPQCNIARRIRQEYKERLYSPEVAWELGYRQCNCCSLVGMRLRKEQKEVEQFCQENDITYHLEDGQLHIQTPSSEWRIVVCGKFNNFSLYHKNTLQKLEEVVSIIPGYHAQAVRYNTILEYLHYIIQHDKYQQNQIEKAKKKADNYRELRRNTHRYRRGNNNCRFSAGQLYSILDNLSF